MMHLCVSFLRLFQFGILVGSLLSLCRVNLLLLNSYRVAAFPPLQRVPHRRSIQNISTNTQCRSSQNNQGEEDLLSKAARLRQEAQDLETQLRAGRTPRPATDATPTVPPPPVYKDLNDSVWTFSYRFASAPDDESAETPAPKYGGKFTLSLRSDGYTDLLKHEPSVPTKSLDIVKVWGWDLEKSAEDDQEYVIFSIDMIVPETDARKERFYFQARQEKDNKGVITLQQGTVTVKQDVTERKDGSSSFWGLFSPKGILARFVYVGDFVARPGQRVT